MNNRKAADIAELIRHNSYVGRGIVIGKSFDGKNAVCAYFIMGRSANSRNRIFTEKNGELFTEPFDTSKVVDPSLIIYTAIKKFGNRLIVTNGDQTDTVYEGLKLGRSFEDSLMLREFEPDAPNYTPRISGMIDFTDNDFSYEMSILKSTDSNGSACDRFFYSYAALSGTGHFIHTYMCDGEPLPSFVGEPECVTIPDSIDEFTKSLWDALDHDNRISLYVRYTSLENGNETSRLINQQK